MIYFHNQATLQVLPSLVILTHSSSQDFFLQAQLVHDCVLKPEPFCKY
jgi:hypothetical protein